MIVGTVCLSHSPLMDRNRAPSSEARFADAISNAAAFVADQKPDLTIVFHPDHLNGFFYNLLPSFCIGVQAVSIGDYGTAAGKLDVPEDLAADLAQSVISSGVDTAVSYQMRVDHGAVQPLELLSEIHSLTRVIPIFVNCAAPPLPTFARVRALGSAVGDWARSSPERILIIGSGGMSHDPPMPSLADARPEMREHLLGERPLNHTERYRRQRGAHHEGAAMASGQSKLRPVNVEWDRKLMDALLKGDLAVLDEVDNASLSEQAGRGSHEMRAWVAALAALGPDYKAEELFCESIMEWITGMGLLKATPR